MIHLGLCVACGEENECLRLRGSMFYINSRIKALLANLTVDRKLKILSPYSGNAPHYHSAWRNNPKDLRVLMISHNPKSTFSRSQQPAIGHYPQPHSSKSLRHIPVLWTKPVSNSPRQIKFRTQHFSCRQGAC